MLGRDAILQATKPKSTKQQPWITTALTPFVMGPSSRCKCFIVVSNRHRGPDMDHLRLPGPDRAAEHGAQMSLLLLLLLRLPYLYLYISLYVYVYIYIYVYTYIYIYMYRERERERENYYTCTTVKIHTNKHETNHNTNIQLKTQHRKPTCLN